MTRENELFFLWERRIVGFEIRGVLVGNEIAFGRAVGGVVDAAVDAVVDPVGLEPAGDELLGEEIGDFGVAGFGVVVYAETAGKTKAGMFVEVDIALHAEESDAESAGFV